MKKVMLMFLAVSSFVFSAKAQIDTTAVLPVQIQTVQLNKDSVNWDALNLTRVQDRKLTSIRNFFSKQKDKVTNDESLTPEERDEQLSEISKNEDTRIRAILTPEQLKIMDSWKSNNLMMPSKINRTGIRDSM